MVLSQPPGKLVLVHRSNQFLRHSDTSDLTILQQKSFKHGQTSSCESWISAVDLFNWITNRCGSFRNEQPMRTPFANEQSSVSVLNTNKRYPSNKSESKDLESNFDSGIQSTKQSTNFVSFLALIWNQTCLLFGKSKIDLPRIELVTTWIFQKWESLVQKLRKQRLSVLLNATGSYKT